MLQRLENKIFGYSIKYMTRKDKNMWWLGTLGPSVLIILFTIYANDIVRFLFM